MRVHNTRTGRVGGGRGRNLTFKFEKQDVCKQKAYTWTYTYCTHVRTHTSSHTHTHTQTYTHTEMHACAHTRTHTRAPMTSEKKFTVGVR